MTAGSSIKAIPDAIDIAVPGDVEPEIRRLPAVILRDIDDLEQVAQCACHD
jgi:glutamyl-tRNA reductase